MNKNINIIPTTQAEHFGKKLSDEKNINIIFLEKNKDNKRYFPDGEVYVRIPQIERIKGKTIILHSGAPSPNSGLVELKMTLEALKNSEANPIEIFFTYFPYGMQDKINEAGEINMAECLIKELVIYYNVKKIYIIDAHFYKAEWIDKYPIINISAFNLLKAKASSDYQDIVYLAPDTGSQKRTGLNGARKKRINSYVVNVKCENDFEKTVKGRTIGVVDDLLETGGTMDRFGDECIKRGAKDITALITHGVLKDGINKVKNKYSKLYLTNTINRDESNIDVAKLILNAVFR